MRRPPLAGSNAGKRLVIAPALHREFWRSVQKGAGCWLWKGSTQHGGYGCFYAGRDSGGMVRAHRAAYAITHGEVPKGAVVMHACDNRLCVNPAHLSIGTQRDNVRDAVQKGRATGSSKGRDAAERIRQEDAIQYLDYLHANLCGLANQLGVGPLPLDFEGWRKARFGLAAEKQGRCVAPPDSPARPRRAGLVGNVMGLAWPRRYQ